MFCLLKSFIWKNSKLSSVCLLRIRSILDGDEKVIEDFHGSLKEGGTYREGTWSITDRRLIHLSGPEVKTDWKKVALGGALFGGIGGTIGTEVNTPESFEDYHLDNLISIGFLDEQSGVLKAVFRTRGHNKRTILIEVDWPRDFKSEVEKVTKRLEKERTELLEKKKMMMKDEKIPKLRTSIGTLQKELKELEEKSKDLGFAYGTGRISKQTYLEKMKEGRISEQTKQIESKLEVERRELAERKKKYL